MKRLREIFDRLGDRLEEGWRGLFRSWRYASMQLHNFATVAMLFVNNNPSFVSEAQQYLPPGVFSQLHVNIALGAWWFLGYVARNWRQNNG